MPGASHVDESVLITYDNMVEIRTTTATDGTEVVAIEPGLHWGDVYTYTDQFNKTQVTGRFYPLGIGLALGVGFSFLSNAHGFATHNGYSFEIALADDRIVTASQTSNSDLYKAQKRGGNNFGIVARYNQRIFKAERLWEENQTEDWLGLT
ncbi:FAD-binding domain-containing protein [Delitschia confertaspora ATCC 74209]|uniref:FAD-binding domain-containing protein n=1 Tax=Delitschia confertaspora ATCC 74209 TaxID=1513339 RepID=A0A9P4JK70_9PLEO|nr:FAD-binding domain-containing protein [Delitschia confertaspora ATCC 74209]